MITKTIKLGMDIPENITHRITFRIKGHNNSRPFIFYAIAKTKETNEDVVNRVKKEWYNMYKQQIKCVKLERID